MVNRKNAKLEEQNEMLEEKIRKARIRERSLIHQLREVIRCRLEPSWSILAELGISETD